MDWMSTYHPRALVEEWNAILSRARAGARILLRSAHEDPAFLNWARVGPGLQRLDEVLRFDHELAARLHLEDRVHTYAGFKIADVAA
jgi:S-adenosylmethionine-diacylglycerol 3-amino-3-carboxypropyl transferase